MADSGEFEKKVGNFGFIGLFNRVCAIVFA